MDLLGKRISHPLEREYEAWIVEQIERYFERTRTPIDIFAISPRDEKTWPSDEAIDIGGKVVGLQFKRPTLEPPKQANDYSRLHWDLSHPAGQLAQVVAHQEIFYVLPTFTNRDARHDALHHSLFWRPPDATYQGAWYDNPNPRVKKAHPRICDAPRWGLFAEKFVRCSTGYRLDGASLSSYVRSLRGPNSSDAGPTTPTNDVEPVMYLLVLQNGE